LTKPTCAAFVECEAELWLDLRLDALCERDLSDWRGWDEWRRLVKRGWGIGLWVGDRDGAGGWPMWIPPGDVGNTGADGYGMSNDEADAVNPFIDVPLLGFASSGPKLEKDAVSQDIPSPATDAVVMAIFCVWECDRLCGV